MIRSESTTSFRYDTVDGCEILHHLGWLKPYTWDKPSINWWFGFRNHPPYDQWPFQEPKLKVPIPYLRPKNVRRMSGVRKYPSKIWPEIWYYRTSINWILKISHWYDNIPVFIPRDQRNFAAPEPHEAWSPLLDGKRLHMGWILRHRTLGFWGAITCYNHTRLKFCIIQHGKLNRLPC